MTTVGYDEWYSLCEKFTDADMKDSVVRKAFEKEFTRLSQLYWEDELTELSSRDIPLVSKLLSELWFKEDPKEILSVEDAYNKAITILNYASDRMTYSRWLHIRYLLNFDIK